MPPAGATRDRLLARLMGSPDLLQVDRLGGSRPITPKVAIVAPSARDDADVDYTFAQVDIATAGIGYQGNCGNISAGVGPFAIDEGLVEALDGVTEVRIFNTNTGKLLVAGVPVRGGRDFGLIGDESKEAINGDARLLRLVREVRGKAAALFGFVDDWREAEERSAGLPMLGLLSRPISYRSINGAHVVADAMDLRVHLLFMGVLHESIAGTGSICLAAAARTPGSVAHALAINLHEPVLRIGHPSGVTPARVRATRTAEPPFVRFDELGFSRTARRIMAGKAYYPAALLD